MPTASAALPSDLHSYADDAPARARHLALVLAVDFAACSVAGTATWHLAQAVVGDALVLDIHGLTIEAVALEAV